MRRLLSRVDDGIEVIERLAILVFLSIMSAAVFFDVVHRISATPNGVILRTLTLLWPGAAPESLATIGVPAVAGAGIWFTSYGALRTARGSTIGQGKAVVAGLGITGLVALSLFGLLKLFPNGLVWSQPLSLGLLLWVALLGATLATKARGHIVIEAAEQLWPLGARRYTRLIGGLVAAAFALLMTVLGASYTSDFYAQWQSGVGYVPSVGIPKWVVFSAMPVCFALMSSRFFAYSISDFMAFGRDEETPS